MDLFGLFGARPDHPLAQSGELERVLALLPPRDPAASLDELRHWLGTLCSAEGFSPAARLHLVERLDEAARPYERAVQAEFQAGVHHRDRGERGRETLLEAFAGALSGAYARCVTDEEQAGKHLGGLGDALPRALARAFRGALAAAKLRAMLYLPAGTQDWLAFYHLLSFAEVAKADVTPVQVYAREVRSTPRAEFLKRVVFDLVEPHELPPEQIELATRILDRFAISFSWGDAPAPERGNAVDLAAGGAPHHVAAGEAASAGRRFFGAGPALAKLAELERQSAANMLTDETRFGAEFSPAQTVTVIRHLLRMLGPVPPRRRVARAEVHAALSVVHGFRAICQRVTAIDAGSAAALDENLKLRVSRQRERLTMQAEEIEQVPETWRVTDQSAWGVGAEIPAGAGEWVEPGVLCGLQARSGWVVAIVRRLDASGSTMRCGLQILSKRPVALWLRLLGREGQQASNWEASEDGFAFDYAQAVVLPDAQGAAQRPVVLLEAGRFVPDQICEIIMGERSRKIRLAEFLDEGADCLRAGFEWIAPEGAPPAAPARPAPA